jgi:hypothetical protein
MDYPDSLNGVTVIHLLSLDVTFSKKIVEEKKS